MENYIIDIGWEKGTPVILMYGCYVTAVFSLYLRVMNINLKAVLFLSQCVAKDMVEQGDGGAIVNVSSQASQCALLDHTVYCESSSSPDPGPQP